ncbi:MAG: endonuclease domain-containing protein [Reichenbachiella sp.]|uniref:endonuclease domain-containing protein n=1 Tax=Reichenbachiella sp. TaxID=2184521 RepID=UPI002966A180|nr:endonuclease domain-containing protein [Reichenbachiella sp.]MDW3209483.1 endonuclease domain-containing protein [Reichenbachiella sp.]
MNNLHKGASSKLFEFAKANRKKQTPAEKILWDALRNRKLEGHKFRRQHPISQFIADFYCHEFKLIVEVDGGYHSGQEQAEIDKGRTHELEELGIKVIRFKNEDVMNELEWVKLKILQQLNHDASPSEKQEKSSP